jgi:PHD/YefM family antitoxin component YafN of YafNO toxin-antitoxin module
MWQEVAMSVTKEAKTQRRSPEIVLRDGQPAAVILDIDEYQDMLERLQDLGDLEMLNEMRQQPLKFKKLSEFLTEYDPSV